MARTRQKIDPLGSGAELLARFKTEAAGWERERMLVIKLAMEGKPTQSIAEDIGRSRRSVHTWITRFRVGGLTALLAKGKGNGPASCLTPEMEAAMVEELKKGVWRTARDAWTWLSANYDVSGLKESVISSVSKTPSQKWA